ncbi:MupA/Atu3671 family FMN-dependent luciferase-like monooxygenase [Ilumatobacter sp.]|uniref:MupA/Atu3671 family FMN-dependent luciferase-like monooxygenase n=1 Tax=Ilumatobacter sp. TaxID=1967498 RepID=UPI003B53002D
MANRTTSSTDDGRRWRCLVVGDEVLTADCARIADGSGLDVVLVATTNDAVASLVASDPGCEVVRSDRPIEPELDARGIGIDVIVSAANLRILPSSLLERSRCSINFHDGPLPEMAGVNVPAWAVLAGHREHGVTWHLMTADVDGGAIVAQRRFQVDERATTHALNTRCYEAAIESFTELAPSLAAGDVETRPQDTVPGTTHLRHERPAMVIDPAAATAHEIDRAVRAHDLGERTVNSFGSVRLVIGDRAYLIDAAHPLDLPPDGPLEPGRVVEVTDAELVVQTALGAIAFERARTAAGCPVALGDVAEQHGLRAGSRLKVPNGLVAALTRHDPRLSRSEGLWWRDLAHPSALPPISVGGAGPRGDQSTGDRSRSDAWCSAEVGTLAAPDGALAATVALAAVWLASVTGVDEAVVAVADAAAAAVTAELAPLARPGTVRTQGLRTSSVPTLLSTTADRVADVVGRGPILGDAATRHPDARGIDTTVGVIVIESSDGPPGWASTVLGACLVVDPVSAQVTLHAGPGSGVTASGVSTWAAQLGRALDHVVAHRDDEGCAAIDVDLRDEDDIAMIAELNDTGVELDGIDDVVAAIDRYAVASPDAAAVSCGDATLSRRELAERVEVVARLLAERGIGPGDRVGVALDRSIDVLVVVLATLRRRGAYVPLDPRYPRSRLRHIADDAGLDLLVADAGVAEDLAGDVEVLHVASRLTDGADPVGPGRPAVSIRPNDLAYVIYTSGSTGTPKGVMIEHAQLTNFLVAMDEVIDIDDPGVWLSVTSLSFDISVLELLWTVSRGFHVVIAPPQGALTGAEAVPALRPTARPLGMSVFYFAAGDDSDSDRYRFVIESARAADRHGFEAVWLPERHFHAFGGAYPNPSVLAAAIAAVTERVAVRAGSVVLPLHSPVRVAEEWAVVDQLSGGRVGISFAAGWQPNDFVLNPEGHRDAKARLGEMIDTVERLWRGETVPLPGPTGMVDVRTLPRPVQAELPIWLTSAGSRSTFEAAGAAGRGLLTHLLGQTVDELADKIDAYRAARAASGHAGDGHVTLMLHSYLDHDGDRAIEVARDPLKRYLGSAVGLIAGLASSFPTFANAGSDADTVLDSLSDDELDQLLDMAAERYLRTSGLFGTVDDAVEMVERVRSVGVDEVACLVDFGVADADALASLELLATVRRTVTELVPTGAATASGAGGTAAETVADLVERHGVTHLQCTPTFAAMLAADGADRRALGRLRHLLVGGEALPPRLAGDLRAAVGGRFTNMYGPTETTIWSLVHEIGDVGAEVPIGRPIANTAVHVLDVARREVPVGVAGELHLGGAGLARGYHGRPELTADRFLQHPRLGRIYATGDLVRVVAGDAGAHVEFLGRMDHQVKIRGHRIELGEIESVAEDVDGVERCVVVASGSTDHEADRRLIAFVTGTPAVDVRAELARVLPSIMVPDVVQVDELPQTPNGKIDRAALVARTDERIEESASAMAVSEPLRSDHERLVAELWTELLGRPVGRNQNFFDLGGHSLLAVTLFRRIEADRPGAVSLTDIFRHPTVESFAAFLATAESRSGPVGDDVHDAGRDRASERGARRRRARARR